MKTMTTLFCASLFAFSLQGCVTLTKTEFKQEEKMQELDVAYQTEVEAVEKTPEQISTELMVEVLRDVFVPIITTLITKG